MHSLLDRSVHYGYGCFGVDFRSPLQVTYNLSELFIDKYYIFSWYSLYGVFILKEFKCLCSNFFLYTEILTVICQTFLLSVYLFLNVE